MFILLILGVALPVMAVSGRLAWQEVHRSKVLDRRLRRVRTRARAVHDEPRTRARGTASGRPLHLKVLFGVLKSTSMLVPVGIDEREKLRRLLGKADFRQADALSVFMAIKLVVTLAGGLLTGFWAAYSELLGSYTLLIIMAGLFGAVIGGMLPEMGLRYLVARRHRRMVAALPDALDLLTLCLESGLTFDRSLTRVAQELGSLTPDLAREFSQVEAELRIGADRKTVLNDLYARTEIEGLRDLATTIVQGERYGTPLTQSMQNIAASERLQRAARIAAQIERLPVLMSMPMLLLVTPGTILLVAGPGALMALEALRSLNG